MHRKVTDLPVVSLGGGSVGTSGVISECGGGDSLGGSMAGVTGDVGGRGRVPGGTGSCTRYKVLGITCHGVSGCRQENVPAGRQFSQTRKSNRGGRCDLSNDKGSSGFEEFGVLLAR